ncbi:TetR/AcrR family transcriptional regulator [Skermania sp. ID1734]|uniref:TetR/AcrR family transcriptional regulator n=1 Tax=Skermania sp. ID1734 TaxID=2597516 RepID=UPI00117DD851|nr:TetR/AcrR family transcriptional regulator [Skermania sp. ID1734]TSE01609.1 TetR/AcrR family transcriptional regulator [Skermania sp. ID1734]
MPGPARQAQILDVCRRLAVTEGYEDVTLERVARECNITRTVIYQQFGGREGMLTALIDREIANTAAGFAEATSGVRDGDVATAVRRVLEAVDADADTWRLFMLPAIGAPPELYDRLERGRSLVRRYLAESARRLAVGDAVDTEIFARLVHAAADEAVRLRLTHPEVYSIDRLVKQIVRLTE